MNLSSTSSFLGYLNSTSTGGNYLYPIQQSSLILSNNGTIFSPNYTTAKAIRDFEAGISIKFNNVDDCLDFLNE